MFFLIGQTYLTNQKKLCRHTSSVDSFLPSILRLLEPLVRIQSTPSRLHQEQNLLVCRLRVCGQSNQHATIVIYNSKAVLIANMLFYNATLIIYDCSVFWRLATGQICSPLMDAVRNCSLYKTTVSFIVITMTKRIHMVRLYG